MREKINLDERWLFHRGDIIRERPSSKGPIYTGAKTVRERWGAASVDYNDNSDDYRPGVEYNSDRWRYVNLPHDYVIEGEYSRDENNALGYFKYDNSWYRRHFNLTEDDMNRRLTLYFEGVSGQSTIYVNGCPLYHNFCGYTSFEVDITDFAVVGDNLIAVYIDSTHHESWWYEGAGIYRHVWLIKTPLTCVSLWGVRIITEKNERGDEWKTGFEVTINNVSNKDKSAKLTTVIRDGEGNIVASANAEADIPAKSEVTAKYETAVSAPTLWNVGKGYLYSAETKLESDDGEDFVTERFGYRTVVCDPNHGLFVNGQHVKIKGVCGHYDFGLTGKAVPDNMFRYRVKMLSAMGANAYRTSHYPQSEALMDAFDEAGFIVLDEIRWFTSSKEGIEQLDMLIKRDRNRPSVFFWCIGNEEMLFTENRGRKIVDSLHAEVRRLDSRPVTCACDRPDHSSVYDDLDVIGINYGLDSYDAVHAKFPDRAIMSTECCATGSTRGWYWDSFRDGGYINAYDHDTNDWFRGRERTWKFIMEREWVMGEYQWIGIEHRGETDWPRVCSQSGAIDLYMQPKDAFWQNKSHWTEEPMVYLMPHWNHDGHEGETVRVRAYTNCNEVELIVDGVSMGKMPVEKYGHAEWDVEYNPGRIEAVGYVGGEKAASCERQTSSAAKSLKLVCENPEDISANGEDIALFTCLVTDENGREVPDAFPTVEFEVNGLGSIVGTGSDVSDHTPVASRVRKMREGRITVGVRCGKTPGILKVYAKTETLKACRCEVEIRKY